MLRSGIFLAAGPQKQRPVRPKGFTGRFVENRI